MVVDRPLHIIHVNDIAFVGSTLVAGLVAAGVTAELLEPATPGAGSQYPWKAASLPVRVGLYAATAVRLRERRPDVIHLHCNPGSSGGPWRRPVLHPLPWLGHPGCGAGRSGRTLDRHDDGAGRRGLRGYAPTSSRRPATSGQTPAGMPNPIDTKLFAPGEAPTRDLLVGTRLSVVKGVDTMIRIVAAARRMRPDITITVVNHGPELRGMLEVAGPSALVVPPLRHDRMPELFRSHRVALGQFALGVLGQFELEAMASGTPIATWLDVQSVYGDQPPVVSSPTADEAAARVVALLEDDRSRADAARLGRAWVQHHHDRDSVVAAMIREYRALS